MNLLVYGLQFFLPILLIVYTRKLQLSAHYLSHLVDMQQIADGLDFPSPSFSGKFFKRMVGVAPKYFMSK